MSVLTYGRRFQCDLCGVQAEGPVPAAGVPRQTLYEGQVPVPDGWVALGYYQLMLADAFGSSIAHLCYVCGGLSIGGLVERMRAKAKVGK